MARLPNMSAPRLVEKTVNSVKISWTPLAAGIDTYTYELLQATGTSDEFTKVMET